MHKALGSIPRTTQKKKKKKKIPQKGSSIRTKMTADFTSEITKAKRCPQDDIFQVLKVY
jgi:hypothetical protein